MKYQTLLSLLLTLLPGVLQAQYIFHTFDVRAGMSDNYVQSILKDRYGFMWFATNNGLNRYDGYQCKTYLTTPFGTYTNAIDDLVEDAEGNIWIQTPERYFLYDREQDRLNPDVTSKLAEMGLQGDTRLLRTDREKNLWGINGQHLCQYTFSNKELRKWPLPPKSIISLSLHEGTTCLLFGDGEVMLADKNGGKLQSLFRIPHPQQKRLYTDTKGRLWIYAGNSSGAECYDTSRKEMLRVPGSKSLETDLIRAILDDGEGHIWIGTNSQGILMTDYGLQTATRIHSSPDNPFALPNNHINCFYKDDQNTIWVGSSKEGVAFARLQEISLEICRTPVYEDVSCFQEDNEGNLWIGFDGKGLLRLSPGSKHTTLFNTSNSHIPSNLIIGAFMDRNGRIWFGSYGGGIFYHEKGNFVRLKHPAAKTGEDPLKFVRHLAEDSDGNLWIGTFNHGLHRRSHQGVFTAYTQQNTCLQTNTITDLVFAQDGHTLYVATSTGLYALDTRTQTLFPIRAALSKGLSLASAHILCLYQDTRGILWIGCKNGLYSYDRMTGGLLHFTEADGLSHHRIRGITEDKERNLWITTDKGLTHIVVMENPATGERQCRCYPYFKEDGIGDITLNAYAVYCTRQGDILAGGNGLFLKIRPDLNHYQPQKHQVTFTGLYIANQRMNVGEADKNGRIVLPQNIQLLDGINLDYSDVSFAIEVSAMDYLSQHKLHFAYRTDPSEEWVRLEGNRIYFNQLAPGTYTLQVKVDEPYGEDNPISELAIHILPPFWLSAPAYGLYILIGLGLVMLYAGWLHKKQRRTLQQQKKEMEAAKLHEMDEAKLRFFTNISHDLRTPLSLIITPLEQLIQSGKAPEAKNELELMQRNASTLMNEVNQLLDFRKLDQQKAQYTPSYGNLSDFVADACETFKALAHKQGITLSVKVGQPALEMNFDRNKMQRILYNLLSNAIKYNREGGSITVAVDEVQTENGETARIQVADTGIGIQDENKERIFDRFFQEAHTNTTYMGSGIGLHIVKEYVALHQGTITVTDNQPTGSIFCILLPMDKSQPGPQPEETAMTDNGIQPENLPTATDQDNQLLIVEDNDDFRKFLASCLKDKYQVQEAANGQQALEVLEQQTVNLIISDVMMPVMDGMELCRRIKHDIRYSHIPIILLTARTAEEHVLSGLKEGADDYITKPFNLDILLLRIQRLLAWTQENHRKFQTMDVSPAEITVSTIDEELIGRAVQIMEEEMDNADFSVEDFSNRLGLSRSGLYKKLMQITGKSPLEFMRILRLKRGKTLLEQSGDSVSQIAYQVGMSPKQFSKFFKEEFGHLPSEHKKHSNGNFALT